MQDNKICYHWVNTEAWERKDLNPHVFEKNTNVSNSWSFYLHHRLLNWRQYDRLIVPVLHMLLRTGLDRPRLSEGRKSQPGEEEKYVCKIQQRLSNRVTRTGLFSSFLSTCWINHFFRLIHQHQPCNILIHKDITTEYISKMTQYVLPSLSVADMVLFITLQQQFIMPKTLLLPHIGWILFPNLK